MENDDIRDEMLKAVDEVRNTGQRSAGRSRVMAPFVRFCDSGAECRVSGIRMGWCEEMGGVR